MTANPFASSAAIPPERGVFGTARLIRSGFLYRVIEFDSPLTGERSRLVYDAWWFRQRIEIGGHLVSFRISWLTIQRHVEFQLPSQADEGPIIGVIEIEFGPGLMIRRFRLWLADLLIYDEIN